MSKRIVFCKSPLSLQFSDKKGNGINLFFRDLFPIWKKRGGRNFFFFWQLKQGIRCILD